MPWIKLHHHTWLQTFWLNIFLQLRENPRLELLIRFCQTLDVMNSPKLFSVPQCKVVPKLKSSSPVGHIY